MHPPQQQQHASAHAARRLLQDEQRAHKAAALMKHPCELVLLRHGETAWNREGRLQGQQEPGPPLTELGMQQAQLAAQVLHQRFPHVDAVWSSDLLRAVQTAEVVAAAYGLQVQQHRNLRERNMGLLQGLTYADAPHTQPEAWAALQSDDTSRRVPGGESLDELRDRMAAAVLHVARLHPGQRVVLISHGGALHGIHRAARGYQAKGKVQNCSISVLLAEPDEQTCSTARSNRGNIGGQQQQQQAAMQQQPVQGQQQQQQHTSASSVAARGVQGPSNGQQPSAAGTAAAAAVSEGPEEPADTELTVVWCDVSDMCMRCISSPTNNTPNAATHVAEPAAAAPAAAAAAATAIAEAPAVGSSRANKPPGSKGRMQQCGGGRVPGGRLALLSWNDSCALQEAHLQSEKAFGGSSRAG